MAASTASSYEPAALEEQASALVEGPKPAVQRRLSLPQKLGLVASTCGILGAACLWLGSTPEVAARGAPAQVSMEWADGATELVEDTSDPCAKYPFIHLDSLKHSNLGGQGPDSGDEGIVYKATDYIPGQAPLDLIMVVNASDSYKAGHARYNGIHGAYGLITVSPGSEAVFIFRFLDPVTLKPKVLTKQEFTFFDLDQSANGDNREYIKVKEATQVWLTKNTEVEVTELATGEKQFMSSQHGSGVDNPKDPLALTVQQKNRAVTMEFENFSELHITMGATAGSYARYFMYVARPSLLCAQTVDPADNGEDEPVTVEETTPAPTTVVSTTPEPQNCLFMVPIINFCVPKFF